MRPAFSFFRAAFRSCLRCNTMVVGLTWDGVPTPRQPRHSMLQIITGKFFASSDRLVHDGLGIAYSNLRTYQPIKTCIASLEPADFSGSYVIKYVNQIEKEPP